MSIRIKALVTFLLVGAVIGVMVLQSNGKLFKGSIQLAEDEEQPEEIVASETQKPDLRGSIAIIKGETEEEDLKADITIENAGPGSVEGNKNFKYSIFINNTEVFSNTDTFTMMEAGDSFNFVYPIPRSIYNYPDTGNARIVIDADDSIDEDNEDNNEIEIAY